MNKYLLCSSIICGIYILEIIYKKFNPNLIILYKLIILGIITSILNHGTTNEFFKKLDRLIITINIIYIIYLINILNKNIKKQIIGYFILAIICFLYSKINKNIFIKNILHLFSHILSIGILNFIH